MSQLNDLKFNALGVLGYTGTVVDRWQQWLEAQGATAKRSIQDQEQEFLEAQGVWVDPNKHLNNAWYAFLGSLGYTQATLDERWYAFWDDGGSIGPPPIPNWDVDPPAVPDGTVGLLYNYSLAADLNTTQQVTITVETGALPDGLRIENVRIVGLPTTEETQAGISLRVTNPSGFDVSLTFDIAIGLQVPVWTTNPPVVPDGQIGVPYSYDFAVDLNTTDGVTVTETGPGTLPAGLSITGTVLSGTPTGSSGLASNLQFTATNSAGSDQSLVADINIQPPTPNWEIDPPNVPDGNVGQPYNYDLSSDLNTTDGVVITVTGGALPNGLSISGTTITGTPTTEGNFTSIRLTATNSAGSDQSLAFDIDIAVVTTVDIRLDNPVQNSKEVLDQGVEVFSGSGSDNPDGYPIATQTYVDRDYETEVAGNVNPGGGPQVTLDWANNYGFNNSGGWRASPINGSGEDNAGWNSGISAGSTIPIDSDPLIVIAYKVYVSQALMDDIVAGPGGFWGSGNKIIDVLSWDADGAGDATDDLSGTGTTDGFSEIITNIADVSPGFFASLVVGDIINVSLDGETGAPRTPSGYDTVGPFQITAKGVDNITLSSPSTQAVGTVRLRQKKGRFIAKFRQRNAGQDGVTEDGVYITMIDGGAGPEVYNDGVNTPINFQNHADEWIWISHVIEETGAQGAGYDLTQCWFSTYAKRTTDQDVQRIVRFRGDDAGYNPGPGGWGPYGRGYRTVRQVWGYWDDIVGAVDSPTKFVAVDDVKIANGWIPPDI